ncbi:MAG: tetratricopeptide repeat protein [Planctomycetes bacterium]|nr:tetratricopeptide repeat protein [Planctomycetota bacterium]
MQTRSASPEAPHGADDASRPWVRPLRELLSQVRTTDDRSRLPTGADHTSSRDSREQFYRTFVQHNPQHIGAHHRLGVLLAMRGEFAQAERHLRFALQCARENAEMLNDLGYCLFLQRRLEEAEHCYRHALALQPNYAAACNNFGLLLSVRGEHDESLAMFRRAGTEEQAQANLNFVCEQLGVPRREPQASQPLGPAGAVVVNGSAAARLPSEAGGPLASGTTGESAAPSGSPTLPSGDSHADLLLSPSWESFDHESHLAVGFVLEARLLENAPPLGPSLLPGAADDSLANVTHEPPSPPPGTPAGGDSGPVRLSSRREADELDRERPEHFHPAAPALPLDLAAQESFSQRPPGQSPVTVRLADYAPASDAVGAAATSFAEAVLPDSDEPQLVSSRTAARPPNEEGASGSSAAPRLGSASSRPSDARARRRAAFPAWQAEDAATPIPIREGFELYVPSSSTESAVPPSAPLERAVDTMEPPPLAASGGFSSRDDTASEGVSSLDERTLHPSPDAGEPGHRGRAVWLKSLAPFGFQRRATESRPSQ